jgi:O-acetylserine/cysteine efflux transporter
VLITTIGGYALYASGLRRLPASVASITAMAEVPFTAALAYLFLGDRLSPLQLCGALIVVGGVALLSLGPGRRNQQRPERDPTLDAG